jgi:hypothetical protein
MENGYSILVENVKGRDVSEDLDVREKIILELILGTQRKTWWAEFIWLRTDTIGRLLRTQ